jgi:putative transcriptional regulator
MKINHHISDALLLDYASGNLSEGWSLAVATHLALCPSCRRTLDAMEGAAGALLDKVVAERPVSTNDWEAMKARISCEPVVIERPSVKAQHSASARTVASVLPEPLRSYVGGDVADLKWRALGRGAYQIRIDTGDPQTQVRLLKIPAGKPDARACGKLPRWQRRVRPRRSRRGRWRSFAYADSDGRRGLHLPCGD